MAREMRPPGRTTRASSEATASGSRANIVPIPDVNEEDRTVSIDFRVEPGERVALQIARLEEGLQVVPKTVRLDDDGSIAEQPIPKEAGTVVATPGR